MKIVFIVYNGGFPYIVEKKTNIVDFHGNKATFTDEDGFTITINRDDILSIETV